jgi:hypothetical protein
VTRRTEFVCSVDMIVEVTVLIVDAGCEPRRQVHSGWSYLEGNRWRFGLIDGCTSDNTSDNFD